MTKETKKRAGIIANLVAIIVCLAMLMGTTFAWFTDSETNSGNIIKSGTLNLEAYWAMGTEELDAATWKEFEDGKIFNNANIEPNHTVARHFKIENKGSLALKFKLVIIPNGAVSKLADVVDVYYANPATKLPENADLSNLNGIRKVGTLADLIADPDGAAYGVLLSEEIEMATIAFKMQETAGNEYQNLSIGDNFDIKIVAAQYSYESDDFGTDYDENAPLPWTGAVDTSWYNDTDTEFLLDTTEQLAGLAQLVDAGNNFAGKTIKLDANIDLGAKDSNGNAVPFNPIGHSSQGKSFKGTFDGKGNTISNMYEQSDLSAWQYEGEYYGLFAYTEGATIKNVTIENAYVSSGRNEAACVVGNAVDTTFADINIKDSTLIAYNNSAGGVAAECYGNCSFTNITVDEDTVIGPLWGTYDVRLGGVVGMVQTGNNVTFKNIVIACQLDAINDVAANYQYWLYRYCGMLIGHVDAVNGVADPSGYVTCEDVKVIYDEWVNYHYCEDADLGAGSYNGPGEYKYARVEAGTGTNGIDLEKCNHNDDESHNVLIVFDQLFGGGQGVKGLKTYDGVTVVYNN
ncbi:MAG: hypothetical protein E7340_02570 [Clostridiales bacterium]|nr:hypothetical protein [Clostridiales bacterium]